MSTSRCAVVSVACALCILASSAHAGLMDMTYDHDPRLYATNVNLAFDPNGAAGDNGLLTASGWSWDFFNKEEPNDTVALSLGDFTLSVIIDPNGVGVSGWLEVTGDLTTYDVEEQLFDSNELVDFAYGGDDVFHFQFYQNPNISGIAPANALLGVILSGVSIPNDIFGTDPNTQVYSQPAWGDQDFENGAGGYSNTFYIPEPCTALVLAAGGVFIHRRRRRGELSN